VDIGEVKHTLCGPMVPVVTNLKPDYSVDYDAIAANVRYVIEHGVRNGQGTLLAIGAGGDFPMLTLEERKQVARVIVEAAAGEAPVLVGAQDTSPAVTIEMARHAERIGAYGIQFSPTYYYSPSDEDVLRLFRSVHEATESAAIMIYNTWWHGYNMSPDVIERLCELDRVVSLKWSTPDGAGPYMRGVARFAERLAVVDNNGLEVLCAMLGGTGFITHLVTVWPENDVALFKRMQGRDYAGALEGFKRADWPWNDFRAKIWKRSGGESNVVKTALELVGRPGGPSRPPTRALNAGEREELRHLLVAIGVPTVA